MSESNYRKPAEEIFQSMRKLFLDVDSENPSRYDNGDTIWPQGNAFNTVLDYMMLTQRYDRELLQYVCAYFENQKTGRYDDWIWPAAASAKAFDPKYFDVFVGTDGIKDLLVRFQKIAQRNWGVLMGNLNIQPSAYGTQKVWSHIYENKETSLYEFKPRFEGGSWQSDITSKIKDSCAGVQLSVMNGLMLSYSGMLSKINPTEYSEYLEMIGQAKDAQIKQKSFMDNWINSHRDDKNQDFLTFDERLFRFDSETDSVHMSDGGVIRERISTYAKNASGKYPPIQMYDKDRIWAGDQGLVLEGLGYLDMYDKSNSDLSLGILKGTFNNFYEVDASQKKSFINSKIGVWNICCPPCYETGGPGIFFRGLLSQLRQVETPLRKELKENADLQSKIAGLAKTAEQNRPSGLVQYEYPHIIGLFPYHDRLALLNLVIYLEEKEGITLQAS